LYHSEKFKLTKYMICVIIFFLVRDHYFYRIYLVN